MTRARKSTAEPAIALERGSGVSLWRQIAEEIEADIAAGELRPGMRLPVEAELATHYKVNRHTLRRALAELARKGFIRATPRLGTFVTDGRLAYPIGPTTRFSEIVAGAGRAPEGRLIDSRLVVASLDVIRLLGLEEGAEVAQLEHVRKADGLPICYAVTWFPADRFALIGAVYAQFGSITAALRGLGVSDYRRRETRISARPATQKEREMLLIERGAPVLVAEGLNEDPSGRPIQLTRTSFAAARVELVVGTQAEATGWADETAEPLAHNSAETAPATPVAPVPKPPRAAVTKRR